MWDSYPRSNHNIMTEKSCVENSATRSAVKNVGEGLPKLGSLQKGEPSDEKFLGMTLGSGALGASVGMMIPDSRATEQERHFLQPAAASLGGLAGFEASGAPGVAKVGGFPVIPVDLFGGWQLRSSGVEAMSLARHQKSIASQDKTYCHDTSQAATLRVTTPEV